MKKVLIVISIALLFMSCNNDDENNLQVESKQIKTIKIYQFYVDSLFYKEEKLTSLKSYHRGLLMKTDNYEYNTAGFLSKKITSKSPGGQLNSVDYEYYPDGRLKSRKVRLTGFAATEQIITYDYAYNGNKIIITDDKYGPNQRTITLDSKNRITLIEKQGEYSQLNFRFCEYSYDENDNITTMNFKSNELSELNIYNFDFDKKTNPFPSLDFKLPNDLSINKLEAVSIDAVYDFTQMGTGDYICFFNFQNHNNITSIKVQNFNSSYNYQYTDFNFPSEIIFKNYIMKFSY